MENLRSTYNKQQRYEFQDTLNKMRQYLVPLLLLRQVGHCALCPSTGPFDIDHFVYNPLVSLNELRLLCEPCHVRVTFQ